MAPSQRRSTRPVRSNRTRVETYEESMSEDDPNDLSEFEYDQASRRSSLSLRPRNPSGMPRTYREESTDGSSEEYPDDSDSDLAPSGPADPPSHSTHPVIELEATTTTPSRPSRPQSTSRARAPARRNQAKRPRKQIRGQLGKPLRKRAKVGTEAPTIIGSGVIPPWQTLPYQILFDIFLRASYPLVDEMTMTRNSSIQWLLDIALLCRSFSEPALAALYYCPPLLPTHRSHGLMNLLSKPQETLSTNYSNKIRELNVDVETILLYKSGPTLGYFNLDKLIEKTPLARQMRLYHKEDYIVGLPQWSIPQSKWSYPDSLFSTMADTQIFLRSWDWNTRFLETDALLKFMREKHALSSFQSLRELRLLHFSDKDREDVSESEDILVEALQLLPDLQRLAFLKCSLVDSTLMLKLPSNLRSFTLDNCIHIYSTDLISFLSSHGGNLRELILSHNRHLNMSYMTVLAQSCSKLERLKMDISMHDMSSFRDLEPHFPHLLCEKEVATWPPKLQDIELIQLRRWDDTLAETFFTSLIDAAPSLPDLRRLVISAILKIQWRERAHFREKWIAKLEGVFLRRSKPPNPNLRSLRKRPVGPSEPAVQDDSTVSPDLAVSKNEPGAPLTTSKRQSSRLAQRKFSEAEDSAESEGEESKMGNIQGMCDIVTIRIDNQRPTDTQFNEDDFLDTERSGDEDWNE
ncbi:hypothetical protein N7510_000246 [Penicillium lagena]|uniref:uncharacterized protein n=1 Tax=Penicillium lagena TaxID=94218 RepID=UPI002540951F|nr:uncharacterized protein N7510_000246 [Penicillium lagena]KAJ5623937.1 hypothetical protein N7510_000246 [Penicillium lagena]